MSPSIAPPRANGLGKSVPQTPHVALQAWHAQRSLVRSGHARCTFARCCFSLPPPSSFVAAIMRGMAPGITSALKIVAHVSRLGVFAIVAHGGVERQPRFLFERAPRFIALTLPKCSDSLMRTPVPQT